jgi:hypothetical protein
LRIDGEAFIKKVEKQYLIDPCQVSCQAVFSRDLWRSHLLALNNQNVVNQAYTLAGSNTCRIGD